jgi:hypothetical protein
MTYLERMTGGVISRDHGNTICNLPDCQLCYGFPQTSRREELNRQALLLCSREIQAMKEKLDLLRAQMDEMLLIIFGPEHLK